MKKIALLTFLFCACTNGRNELMTKLINERKVMNDSIAVYKSIAQSLQDRVGQFDRSDSASWQKILDTARMANDGISNTEARIASLTFSIDSLSKMK